MGVYPTQPGDQPPAAEPTSAAASRPPPDPVAPTMALALAQAVARPGGKALRLTPTNVGDGWIGLEAAIAAGVAYAVDVDDEVLALDLDGGDPELGELLDDLADYLDRRGVPPVVVDSGQPGHRHLFARLPAGELRAQVEQVARQVGIDVRGRGPGRGGPIRPPLAPHRRGLLVRLRRPSTAAEALTALQPAAPASAAVPGPTAAAAARVMPSASSAPARAAGHGAKGSAAWTCPSGGPRPGPRSDKRLSVEAYRLLRYGAPAGHQSSRRSNIDLSIAMSALQAGWTPAGWRAAMLDPGNAGGRKPQEILAARGELAARRYLDRTWANAEALVAASPPIDRSEVVVQLHQMRLEMDNGEHDWSRQSGANDYEALVHLIARGTWAHTLAVHYSERDLADDLGVVRHTARAALRRLEARGWITKARGKIGDHAILWRLLPGRPRRRTPTSTDTAAGGGTSPPTAARPPEGALANDTTGAHLDGPAGPQQHGMPPGHEHPGTTRLERGLSVSVPCPTSPLWGGWRPHGKKSRGTARAGHDAFRWKGMGGPGRRVLQLLLAASQDGQAVTEDQLADWSCLHPATVRKHLRHPERGMMALGLVERLDDGTYQARVTDEAALDEALDEAAEVYGTTGRRTDQRHRHEQERAALHDYFRRLRERLEQATAEVVTHPAAAGKQAAPDGAVEAPQRAHAPPAAVVA